LPNSTSLDVHCFVIRANQGTRIGEKRRSAGDSSAAVTKKRHGRKNRLFPDISPRCRVMHAANYKCNDLIHINDDSPMTNVTKIKFHRPGGRGRARGDNRVALTAATLARKRHGSSIRLCFPLLRKPPLLSERALKRRSKAQWKTDPGNRDRSRIRAM